MKRFHLAILVVSLLCLVLTACGGTPSSPIKRATPTRPQQINITIGDFYIHSPVTTFFTGRPYLLVVTNVGTHHHDLFIMHPMETMTMTMADVYNHALINIYNIAPNETKTLNVIFDHTAPPGMLEFSCHYGGHYEAGMRQAIVVKATPGASVSPYPNNGIPLDADSQLRTGPCDPATAIKIANNTYAPASISLKKGDTLTVTNTDKETETLTTTPDAATAFTTIDSNKTAYVTFLVAGTFTLSSREHPEAKATIAVSKTAGTTCGMTLGAMVSFDANFANPANNRYFFIPTQVTIKQDQSLRLSNLADLSLSFASVPDIDLGRVVVWKNQYRDLKFTNTGTYTISCVQFPNKKFTVTVRGT